MFDIGWTEITAIVIIAVLVIGPKDLPKAMRTVAKWVGKVKGMMREFQGNIDEMIKETELEEVKNQISSARTYDVNSAVSKTIDPEGEMSKAMDFSKESADFNASMKESTETPEKSNPDTETAAVPESADKKS